MNEKGKEPFKLVVVGHVDHGKSTLIGRLLADTNSLPEGKLEQVKEFCEKNSKPFEYAFLLDALKEEQEQGITIDTARIFFKTKKREYLILDAPGHIEFLKNMITGAARAEAALLVIDAKEGIKENSKRHAYVLSLLGIKEVGVVINKMDLVGYDQKRYEQVKQELSEFLKELEITPREYIPVSAFKGTNITTKDQELKWYKGPTLLELIDDFKKEEEPSEKPLRLPIQDVYKFTKEGDDRRIIAGRIESGTIRVGDEIIILPSGKTTTVKSIEEFNKPKNRSDKERTAGYSIGITLTEQIYARRGEVICKKNEKQPKVSTKFKTNIFWMGKEPLTTDKEYKIKINTSESPIKIKKILKVLNTSSLTTNDKEEIGRFEVGEAIIESLKPLVFDTRTEIDSTSRFVIIDDYDIRGGGIITNTLSDKEEQLLTIKRSRETKWDRGYISFEERATRYSQKPLWIMITGKKEINKKEIAYHLEKELFNNGKKVYFLGIRNILRGLGADIKKDNKKEHLRRLAEVSNILVDAGLIVISTASDLTEEDYKTIKTIVDETIIVTLDDEMADLELNPEEKPAENAKKIIEYLKFKKLIFTI